MNFYFAACSGVIDLVFVLDDSGTVHMERWQYVLQFVINVVQNLDVSPTRTQVGMVGATGEENFGGITHLTERVALYSLYSANP